MRPSRNRTLMESAHLWAQRSTCSRLRVGAVFAKEGRILVTGYNGAPAGLPHCNHDCTCTDTLAHHEGCPAIGPCKTAVHAEQNGVAYAARWGIKLESSSLFVTHTPCLSCAMSIINAGVEEVFFEELFRDTSGLDLLLSAEIKVVHTRVIKAIYERLEN